MFLEQTSEDKYTLQYQDSAGNMKEYKRAALGIFDNDNVYIKYNKHYARFMAIGKICVFKFSRNQKPKMAYTGSTTITSAPGRPVTTSTTWSPMRYKTKEKGEESYILDVNTGKITTLKVNAVKKLITDDAELSAEFNQLGKTIRTGTSLPS